MRRLIFFPVLLSLPVGLSAQMPLPPASATVAPNETMIEWPAFGSGPVRRVEGGRLLHADFRSAIGLRGPTAGLAVQPAVTGKITQFDLEGAIPVDCVTLPGAGPLAAGLAGPQEQLDAILFTALGGAELRFVAADPAGQLSVTGVAFAGWGRASMLCALPVAGGVDVVARAQATNTVLHLHYQNQLGFSPWPSIVVDEPIRDLCNVDLNNDGVVEIAVLTDTKLRVFDGLGTVLRTVPLTSPGGAIEPVFVGSVASLALLRRRAAPSVGWEIVHLYGGSEVPVPITIDGNDFVLKDMVHGDFDDDGDTDLVIQDGGIKTVIVKHDEAAVPPVFSQDIQIVIGDHPGAQSRASVVDYDYDGIVDLLIAVAATNGKHYLVLVSEMRARMLLQNGGTGIFDDALHEVGATPDPGDDEFILGLNTSLLVGFDKVQITWYQGDETQPDEYAVQVEQMTASVDAVLADPEALMINLPATVIDHPKLIFIKLQLSSLGDPKYKPTYLAGCTIDNEYPIPPPAGQQFPSLSPYLTAHKLPDADEKKVKRTPTDQGRQQIGILSEQVHLPIE